MKNKGVYRLLSGVLCTSVLLSSQVYAATPADYSDFPQNWSKDAMTFAVKNNYITGVSEDKIAPKAALTRAQLAAILSRVMKTGAGDVSVLDNFNDADKNAWYAGSMAKAVELNILYGDGDSIYPDRPVTRQELFTILVRAFSVTGGDESALAPYSDAGSVSSWARAAISAMIAQGYAAGYEDKTIRPTQQVTREEFAQLLYRMQEFYGSSDSSDNKTETKTDETTKTDGKTTSGGGGGGSSSGGGSHGGGSTVTANKIVDETKATVQSTSMGAWLPLVFADNYTFDSVTSVTVNGTEAKAALSKVTTDGSIAKLALTGTPKQVVITTQDGKTQTITLSGSDSASVYTGTGKYLPDYVLAHGAVAAWDYHLTNYDKEGNVRTKPTKTTFDTQEAVNTHPYYSPDTVIAEDENADNLYHVSGTVEIMFNYNTDAEKAWFDGIGNTVALVENNGRYNQIGTLDMTKEVDVAHGSGKVGVLRIPVGQSNFYSNGRYYVRVQSTGGDQATTLVPIHLVNDVEPVFQTTESAVSGVNLHFNVKNMTYGITSPIERVTLTDPTGATKTLRNIDDYYLLGTMFVLYNDVDAENGVNNIPYNGKYTMTVYSNGFKTVSKSFFVTDGTDAPTKQAVATYKSAAYDVVTHATTSGGSGDSSSDGDSYMVSANLMFKSDLLANALVLDKVGKATAASDKVVEDWYNMSGYDSLLNEGDVNTYYKWVGYQDKINDAKYEKNDGAAWLPFSEYIAGDVETDPNRPYAVKEVLEDGLLGDVQHSNTYGRKDAPEVTVERATQGEAVVLKFADKDHFDKVENLFINGNWQALDTAKYSKNTEELTITIDADCFKIGENTVGIDAAGYVSKSVKVDYAKVNEENLSLTIKNADSLKEGNPITIEITGSEGDFLNNLSSVVLNDGKTEDTVWEKNVEGSDAVYYVIADDKKSITLYNVKAGNYTLSLRANYYTDALTTTFTVAEKDAETVTTPAFDSYALSEDSSYYRISFKDATATELKAYLDSVEKVIVGETEYTRQVFSSGDLEEGKFRVVASNPANGQFEYDKLDLPASAVTQDEVTVVLKATEGTGYADVEFTINKTNGGGTTDPTDPTDPDTKAAPAVDKITERSGDGRYEVSFVGGNSDAVLEYLGKITAVTVGETSYEASKYTPSYGSKEFCSTVGTFDSSYLLKLGSYAFTDGVTITVKADGYEDLVFTYPLNSDNNGGDNGNNGGNTGGETETKTAPEVEEITEKSGSGYYEVSFKTGNTKDTLDYLSAITGVTVGSESYEVSKYTPNYGSKEYCSTVGTFDSSYLLKLGSYAFVDGVTITVKAEGYEDLTFTYPLTDNSGSDNGETEGKDTPTEPTVEASFMRDYYQLQFNANDDWKEIENYFAAIEKVVVNNNEYSKSEYSYQFGDGKYILYPTDKYIKLATNGFAASGSVTTIVIKATGYKDLTITYTAK